MAVKPSRTLLVTAFASVYLIWGSTYLAIRFAIESIPPFLMAGVRFVIAGVALYTWARLRGGAKPSRTHWRTALIVGGFLLLGGNGGVVWAEQTVASGVAALIVATVPLWITTFEWARAGARPPSTVVIGIALGFGGVVLLVGPAGLVGGVSVPLAGAGVLVLASLLWSAGSLYSRRAAQPESQPLATAMSMIAGGVLLILAAALTGELARFDAAAITRKSALALVYLIVFGALVGYSAFLWLMRATTPERAATYAYVNPVVAVLLGWLLASEPLSPRTLVAATIIIGSVALIVSAKPRRRTIANSEQRSPTSVARPNTLAS